MRSKVSKEELQKVYEFQPNFYDAYPYTSSYIELETTGEKNPRTVLHFLRFYTDCVRLNRK